LILVLGDNPFSRVLDSIIDGIAQLFGIFKNPGSWFSGRHERVFRFGVIAMVLIAIVGIAKVITRKK